MEGVTKGSRIGTPDNSIDHGDRNSVDVELAEPNGFPDTTYNVVHAASTGARTGTPAEYISHDGESDGEVELVGPGGFPGATYSASPHPGSPKSFATAEKESHSSNPGVIPENGVLPKKEKVFPIIEPSRPQISGLSENVEFWDTYLKEAEEYDKEMIASWSSDLDSILIFAGLFSAVNTAFIVESYGSLKADPADATNTLLRILINRIDNTTFVGVDPSELLFAFAAGSVRNNAIFFASLSSSLLAAFGAVLAKQWLNQYLSIGVARSARSEKGRARQRKFDGLVKWKFQPVVEALPLLLQTSLVLFLIALIDFLWPLSHTVSLTVIVLTGLGAVFYVFTTMASTLYDDCPFQTPISHSLRPVLKELRNGWFRIVHRINPSSGTQSPHSTNIVESTEMIDAQTVAWLLQTVSELKPRLVATRAVRYLRAPAAHPYFSARETVATLMDSFASCFQDRRVDHDGTTVYTASPAVLDMVDVAGHALCQILSTAPHSGEHNANNPYLYADLLPSLDFSCKFVVEDTQGTPCYTAHHLSRVIRWMAEGDVGDHNDEGVVWIPFPGGMSMDGLGVSVQDASDWEKLQLSHVVNHIFNCADSLEVLGVKKSLSFFSSKILEKRPLPPLNILCDVLLISAHSRERPGGIRNGADLMEISDAKSNLSGLNLCLLLFLKSVSQSEWRWDLDLSLESISNLLEDLVTHGVHIGAPYTTQYLECAQTLLDHTRRQSPRLRGTGVSYMPSLASAGLRMIDAIVLDLQSLRKEAPPQIDDKLFLSYLNAFGAHYTTFISEVTFSDSGHLAMADRNVLSLLWALSGSGENPRQIFPPARFLEYPSIPVAICYSMLIFRKQVNFPFPFQRKVEFPITLLEECMELWFDYRETNIHKMFINARFGEMLLILVEESSVPAGQPSIHHNLNYVCRKLVNHLTSTRPDLWAAVFSHTSMLHLVHMQKSVNWVFGDNNLTSPWTWLSRLLLFQNTENELDEIEIGSVVDMWRKLEEYREELGESRSNGPPSNPPTAWEGNILHNEMLKLVTLDGLIAYTYLAIASNPLSTDQFRGLNQPGFYRGQHVQLTLEWRLQQDCPEDIAALIRCMLQYLMQTLHHEPRPEIAMDREPGISTWNRCRASILAHFIEIDDLQTASLDARNNDLASRPRSFEIQSLRRSTGSRNSALILFGSPST